MVTFGPAFHNYCLHGSRMNASKIRWDSGAPFFTVVTPQACLQISSATHIAAFRLTVLSMPVDLVAFELGTYTSTSTAPAVRDLDFCVLACTFVPWLSYTQTPSALPPSQCRFACRFQTGHNSYRNSLQWRWMWCI